MNESSASNVKVKSFVKKRSVGVSTKAFSIQYLQHQGGDCIWSMDRDVKLTFMLV